MSRDIPSSFGIDLRKDAELKDDIRSSRINFSFVIETVTETRPPLAKLTTRSTTRLRAYRQNWMFIRTRSPRLNRS